MNKEKVKKIIESLGNEFDTHKFIEKLIRIREYEKEYVELLHSHIDKNGIFKAAHSEIGKFLADNSSYLEIEKANKECSENIKKYGTKNQIWRRKL